MMPVIENLVKRSPPPPPASSRILDIPCKVCGDNSSGKHYNIYACDGCAGFFKRSIRRNRQYVCKAREEGSCIINKLQRNQCRACRLTKCQSVGMNKDAVQHERGPRNSTLRRQQYAAQLFVDSRETFGSINRNVALDLALPKPNLLHPPMPAPPIGMIQNYLCPPAFPFPGFGRGYFHHFPAMPPILPQLPTSISELAAQCMFTNINWAKTFRSFISLPKPDQVLLLEETWSELLIISLGKQFFPLDINQLIEESGYNSRNSEESTSKFVAKVQEFLDTVRSIAQYQLDEEEYSYVRAMVLFKTNIDRVGAEEKKLISGDAINAVQDQVQLELSKHISRAYPHQPARFGRILMMLPTLRNVHSETIQELFFRRTIGPCPIETVIKYLYKDPNSNVL